MMLRLRSALFLVWFALVSLAMNVVFLPILMLPYSVTLFLADRWARLVLWGLRVFAGTGLEVRGTAPTGAVLVACKHFSMWETVAMLMLLHRPAIVMKRSLLRVPLYGWYSRKMRMIAIDRTAGAHALRKMEQQACRARRAGRPILIFPEGTRRPVWGRPAYKPGIAGLYLRLGIPCVPVAHNSGLFWDGPFLRKPGTIVVEYLEPIAPGLDRRSFMAVLEERIETATAKLLEEGQRQLAAAGP
jgi:1-acyl-sn-glycerol-3-phosphate acyltransferase